MPKPISVTEQLISLALQDEKISNEEKWLVKNFLYLDWVSTVLGWIFGVLTIYSCYLIAIGMKTSDQVKLAYFALVGSSGAIASAAIARYHPHQSVAENKILKKSLAIQENVLAQVLTKSSDVEEKQ